MFRIGENNPPFSFAIFSNPEEETLNASLHLDSNGTHYQQVGLRLETNGLVDFGRVCSLGFLLQALNPEASPWIPTECVPGEFKSLPQPDYSVTSSKSDYQDFPSSACSSLSSSPPNGYDCGYEDGYD